jgi:putative ABC transport system permease protein
MTRTHPHRHGSHQRHRRARTAATARGSGHTRIGLGSAGAFANLAAGCRDDLGTLSRVPVPHVLGIAIRTPIAAMIAGWTLAGREPPAISRQPMS